MLRKLNSKSRKHRKNRNRTARRFDIERLESKQLLTAVHVDQADDQPDDRGCGPTDNPCNSIATAIHFAPAGSDIVLKPDVYHEAVHVSKNLAINSVGGRSTIIPLAGPAAVTTAGGVRVTLRNLDLTGGVVGLDSQGSEFVELFDVRATDNLAHGIIFAGGKLDVHQGEFSRNGSDGIVLTEGANVYMVDSLVQNNGGHGILATESGSIVLDNPLLEDNGMAGAFFDRIDGLSATDIRAVGNVHDGVVLDGAKGETIIDRSWFIENGGDGLLISGAADATTLRNVTAESNALNGVGVVDTKEVFVTNAIAKHNGMHGLAATSAEKMVVDGGEFSHNSHGLVVDAVSDSITIQHAEFRENKVNGVTILEANDVTVVGTSTEFNAGDGISMGEDVKTAKIRGNLRLVGANASNNGGNGLRVSNATDITIEGGTFSKNQAAGMLVQNSRDLTLTSQKGRELVAFRNMAEGLSARNVRHVTIGGTADTAALFDQNGAHGISLAKARDVDVSFASGSGNRQAGLNGTEVNRYTDKQSVYISNFDHGIAVKNVTTDVSLTDTLASGNDANGDAIGDGVHVRGVQGSVRIVDGTYDFNPFGTGQQNGASLYDVDGTVTIKETATGKLSFSNNSSHGLDIQNVGSPFSGGDVTIEGGSYQLNGASGIRIRGTNGYVKDVNVASIDASNNFADGMTLADIRGDVLVDKATFKSNGVDGASFSNVHKMTVLDSTADQNVRDGLHIMEANGLIDVQRSTMATNVGNGMRVVDAHENVSVLDSDASRNGLNGIAVFGADKDVNIVDSGANNNVLAGIAVGDVSAKGMATDFKVTANGVTANGNGTDGIQAIDVERVLVKDSETNGNGTGIRLTRIVDDVTLKRSTANGNSVGVLLDRANDVNLQFFTAEQNAQDGLRAVDGSTVHATGGSFSGNGESGWDIANSGDVSGFATSYDANGKDGVSLSGVGAVSFDSSSFSSNTTFGFNIENADTVVLENLSHTGNLLGSSIAGTNDVVFVATNGEDEIRDRVEIGAEGPIATVDHVRTLIVDGDDVDVPQDRISIAGATSLIVSGGDGDDALATKEQADLAGTSLEELYLLGAEGSDSFDVSHQRRTELFVDGAAPESAPGDRLTVSPEDRQVKDDGEKLTAEGYADIHYTGIEHLELGTSADNQPPTVQIIDVTTSGPTAEIVIRFNEPVRGLDVTDLELRRNGALLDLSAASLTTTDDGTTWVLGNLSSRTAAAGEYSIELDAVDSAIADLFGNELRSGDEMQWKNVPGDANGDGQFDSSDLIAAFVAGKYETGEPASNMQGDWNNDGVFDSNDLIYVFVNGQYRG